MDDVAGQEILKQLRMVEVNALTPHRGYEPAV